MKKILALVLASALFVTSSVCAFAQEQTGSVESPTPKEIMEKLEQIEKENAALRKSISDLTRAVQAKNKGGGGSSNSGGGSGSSSTTPSGGSNYVNFGGNITYQGGKIEINGGRSNVTFTIKAPASGTVSSAASLAGKVGGSLVSCIETSSPGVAFSTAKVNFYVSGVQAGENIAVYQNQNGTWVQLPVVEIRKDHVVVNMSRHGSLAFVRVPVMATITQ
ncbi:MAG: hypothetical protein ILA11_11670 [Butyrivibrio sp.]|nr:hypothetical protein [Butyrivibrio sp.]